MRDKIFRIILQEYDVIIEQRDHQEEEIEDEVSDDLQRSCTMTCGLFLEL